MTSVSMTCQLKREVTMKRINLRLKVAATTLSLLFFAPAAFAANSADDTFTIGIGITLDSLDPAQQTTTTVMNVLDYDVQTLVTFDEKGKLQPLLAKSWSWSDDKKSLTLKLRDGVTFHDGTPFNARSEEQTSELQSLMRISYAVFCLNKKSTYTYNNHQ